jgi:hypothetical protein
MRKSIITWLMCIASFVSVAQNNYSNFSQQSSRLNALSKQYASFAKLSSLAKTAGGKEIWMLVLGTGNTESKPGIAVVGGVEGNHLLGTELAIGFAEKLLKASGTDSIKNLLANTTFYVFPNMSPDAMEQYFAPLKYERMGNAIQTDDDRDGKTNEDGYDDLDGNGKITMMRVESPIGDYRISTEDSRVLVKADIAKGEKGKYLLFTEGTDNDKDGVFNEDGEGGVWFNKNFSFKHPSFTPGSGEFAVSEIETRAIADKLYELFNVYAVISFSSVNNLSTPQTFNAGNTKERVITGWLEADTKANAMVSDLYNKNTSMKDAPKSPASVGGDFASWVYYHYGRLSFSTPGWFVPKAKNDTALKEKPFADTVANFIKWSSQQNLPNNFTEWKKIQHPDFPGQEVEIGGVDPFALINPPYAMADAIVTRHTNFIVKLAALQSSVDIVNVKVEKLGSGINRITADIINKGALPSHAKLGERTYWVKRINVKLNSNNNQSLISGKKIQLLPSLEGFSSNTITWLVKGAGNVSIEAGSPTTGIKTTTLTLQP